MKILILTNNYPNRHALSNGVFVHQQVKALQGLGADCRVLQLHNWYPPLGLHKHHAYWRDGHRMHNSFFVEYEGVKVYPVPMFVKMPTRLFRESYYDRAARSIIAYVSKTAELHDAEWLYAHFLTDCGFIGAKVKDALHVKLAAIARGDDIHAWPEEHPSLRPNLAYVFEKADLLLANSHNLGVDARKWMLPGKERTVSTVYNGIDHTLYRPAEGEDEKDKMRKEFGLTAATRYLVCVGTPVALKGWVELLTAIRQLGDAFDGWQLLMVAPRRQNHDALDLDRISREMRIDNKCRHMGELTPAGLAVLFRACDAFVLPSYNEGMANALLEAMATGLPCIATEVGGHNEVVENGKNGLLIAPQSVEEIVVAIKTVVANDGLRSDMGSAARQQMLALGDYRQNAQKLLAMMERTGVAG